MSTRRAVHPSDRWLAIAGVAGVAGYVGTWFVLGLLREGYAPTQQAISELFEIGAPTGHRIALSAALVVTGLLLVPFGAMLDRRLPEAGRSGPWLLAYSGVMTAAVAAFPCTSGCPGAGSSFTDTMHVVTAGSGYVALVTAPLFVGRRLRDVDRGAAQWCFSLGAVALVGFLVRNAGVDELGGLQQRLFNTTADVWIALMGWWVLTGRWDDDGTARPTGAADGGLTGDRGGAGAPPA